VVIVRWPKRNPDLFQRCAAFVREFPERALEKKRAKSGTPILLP